MPKPCTLDALETRLLRVGLGQQSLDVGPVLLRLPGASWDLALPALSQYHGQLARQEIRMGVGKRHGPVVDRTEVTRVHCFRCPPVNPVSPLQ